MIEMIVATVLLAIGIAGALAAFAMVTRANSTAEQIQMASFLAQQQLTQLELQPSQISAGDQQGDFGDQYPGYRWQQNIQTTDYSDLFLVTVTVQWGMPNAPQQRSITTYLRNDPTLPGTTTTTGTGTTTGGATGGG